MRYFPINLDVRGRDVLVIGGGRVALRKVEGLVACGARVTVVSPAFCDELASMEAIRRVEREYREGDMRGACLVVSAANSQAANEAASEHASKAGIPVNVVDQPELCTFTVPAVLSRGDLLIAISTSGASPALAGRIRRMLAEQIGPEYARHLDLLREMRPLVKASALSVDDRGKLLKRMAGDGIREIVERTGVAAARSRLKEMLSEATGGGPPQGRTAT